MRLTRKRTIVVIVTLCLAVLIIILAMPRHKPEILVAIDKGQLSAMDAILGGNDPGPAIQPYLENVRRMLDESPRRIKARDKWGATVLHYGCYHKDMVRLLVSRGAKVNAKDKQGGTPLHLAVIAAWINASGVEELVAQGADVNAKNRKGQTPWDVFVRHHAPLAEIRDGRIVGIRSAYEDIPAEQREIKERELGRVSDALRSQ